MVDFFLFFLEESWRRIRSFNLALVVFPKGGVIMMVGIDIDIGKTGNEVLKRDRRVVGLDGRAYGGTAVRRLDISLPFHHMGD